MKAKLSILPLLLILAACAQLGLEAPKTFTEKLAYAVSQNSAIREAAATSLKAGDIKVEDAQHVLKFTDQVRTALDGARIAADVGDTSTAEARLTLATGILVQLQSYLRERSAK